MSELRWNPVLEEWVVTATHRQDRTFFPPPDFCPICPTKKGKFETEIPSENYDIVVFENKFPSFNRNASVPAILGDELYKVKKSRGICEVIVYTPEHNTTLADQSVEQIHKLVYVWKDRYEELGSHKFIKYVFIFENKGEVIGVTLHHPHGQIYSFSYIPPKIQKELLSSQKYMNKLKKCLFCDILDKEIKFKKRIVYTNKSFTAFIPFFARYPYEVHIYANRHIQAISDFTEKECLNLAKILKVIMKKYDNLFEMSFPYIMVMHQKPTDGKKYNNYHWHIEFYPPYRTKNKIKFLAGCESGAGTFINDTMAEEKAKELRKIKW
ncbi:MAG: galactose-1-phosphate uridylyltransferase [Candidatus Firestonebacteria bacterium]